MKLTKLESAVEAILFAMGDSVALDKIAQQSGKHRMKRE